MTVKGKIKTALTEGATSLDLSGLGLKELPAEIGDLTTLTSLDLRGNNLTMIDRINLTILLPGCTVTWQ